MTRPSRWRPARARALIGGGASVAWLLIASGTASAAAAAVIGAAASGGVIVEVEDCPSLDQAALRQLVAIEIGDLLLPPHAKVPLARQDRVTIRCDGVRVHLVVAVAAGGAPPVERTLNAADFPGDAAPRVLALAGVEMLAASSPTVRRRVDARQGIAATPATPATPSPRTLAAGEVADDLSAGAPGPDAEVENTAAAAVPPPPDPRAAAAGGTPEEPAPATPRTEVLIGLAVVRRAFLVPQGVSAWGATVGADREVGARWLYRVDVEGDAASQSGSYGDASALLASLGGFAGARWGRSDLSAALAVGGRLGLVRLAGAPAAASIVRGDSVLRAWGGPALTARLFSGAGRLGLSLSAEAGWAAIGAEGLAQRAVVVAARGFWLTGGAGIWF